jgi:hypothetical protein
MNKLKSYQNFKQLLLLNEGYLYFSPKFEEIIIKINRTSRDEKVKAISYELYHLFGKNIKDDITFVDISKNKGFLTHLKDNSLKKVSGLDQFRDPQGELPELGKGTVFSTWQDDIQSPTGDGPFNHPSRTEIKLSRLLNRIMTNTDYSTRDRENFVQAFLSELTLLERSFKVVTGDDIIKYYNESNYSELKQTLGSSCMRYTKCASYLEIYAQNPDVCSMLVLLDGARKVTARALLWKLHESSVSGLSLFMDRVYFTSETELVSMNNWAKDNGYAYKEENNFKNLKGVILPTGDVVKADMKVLCKGKFDKFPYVDTFRLYDPRTGILENSTGEGNEMGDVGKYILSQTDGGYKKIKDTVYSDWYDEEIPREYSVWSEGMRTYILENEAVRVTIPEDMGYYHPDLDYIVYSSSSDAWVNTRAVSWSDTQGEWIPNDQALLIVTGLVSNLDFRDTRKNPFSDFDVIDSKHLDGVIWIPELINDYKWFQIFFRLKKRYIIDSDYMDHSYQIARQISGIKKDLFEKTFNRLNDEPGICLKGLTITTYKVEGNDEWVSQEDANYLGYELSSRGRIESVIDYEVGWGPKFVEDSNAIWERSPELKTDNWEKRVRDVSILSVLL